MTQLTSRSRHLRVCSTAVLVIHGIGEQNPYETLDAFAHGIFSFLEAPKGGCRSKLSLSPKILPGDEPTRVAMQINVPDQGGAPGGKVDVYEYYWAPYTEDKISAIQTLKWLIRTDLSPLLHISSDLQELAGAIRRKRTGRAAVGVRESAQPAPKNSVFRLAWLFLRELRRILFLYIPLFAMLLWVLFSLPNLPSPTSLWDSLREYLSVGLGWARPAVLVFDGLAVLMSYLSVSTLLSLVKRRGKSVQKWGEGTWVFLAALSAFVFFWLASKTNEWGAAQLPSVQEVLRDRAIPALLHLAGHVLFFLTQREGFLAWGSPDAFRVFVPLWMLGIAWFLRYVLTGYVGDIAVYTTADEKSKSYEARENILRGSTRALTELLLSTEYDQVILAGHSLGSVIAYDTVNELIASAASPSNPPSNRALEIKHLRKLTGLVTFGSPLDKIYYFFRQQVKEGQAIRAQILSMLNGFRKRPSGRDYDPYTFRYDLPQLPSLLWLNAWSPLDPVSGNLNFYDVDRQAWFWYSVPGYAHLGYWSDPKFFQFWGNSLLIKP